MREDFLRKLRAVFNQMGGCILPFQLKLELAGYLDTWEKTSFILI